LAEGGAQTAQDALHDMAQMAGVIFAGQVIAVRRHDGVGGATGVVEIDFAVEDAVRGVGGGEYTVREWAGMWAADDVPFRVGQRYLMLLHSPGPSGLSSPVCGMDGAIPIRGTGAAVGPSDVRAEGAGESGFGAAAMLRESGAQEAGVERDDRAIDLSWVGTRVVRQVSYSTPTAARPIMVYASSAEMSSGDAAGASNDSEPVASYRIGATQAGLQHAAYADVLGMLRAWERGNDAAR
jgi:hypothetical protein